MRKYLYTSILCFAVGLLAVAAWASPMHERIKVDFNHAVNVGDQTIQPGHYTFIQMADQTNLPIFRIQTPNGDNVTVTAVAINAAAQNQSGEFPEVANQTDIVLKKIGDTYYLDKILVQGRHKAWQFDIPSKAKAQMAKAEEEHVAGTYDEGTTAADGSQQSSNQMASNSNGSQASRGQSASTQSSNQNSRSSQYNQKDSNAASNSSGNSSAMAANNSGNGELVSVTGCLNPTDKSDHFTLKTAPGQWTHIVVAPDLNQEIASETGKTVRVVGVWLTSSDNSQSASNTSAVNNSDMNNSTMNNLTMSRSSQTSAGNTQSMNTQTMNGQTSGNSTPLQAQRVDVISQQCAMN